MFITEIHSRFEKKLEAQMFKAMHHYMRLSFDDYSQRKRKNWVKKHPEQIAIKSCGQKKSRKPLSKETSKPILRYIMKEFYYEHHAKERKN